MHTQEQKIHLSRQLDFITRSCESYDSGFHDEAIRIAQSMRVLFHDTRNSTSLLSLMQKKSDIRLLTTCSTAPLPAGLAIMDCVSIMTMNGMKPCLSTSRFTREVPIIDWWEQVVLVTGPKQKHSRKSIILATANKDGGSHIDGNITPKFKILKDGFWTFEKGNISEELTDYHFIGIRQFGYEIINSHELTALTI